jgi:diamine N-acetyltransferase
MGGADLIRGKDVVLRPAAPEDRRMIFDWLFRSDVTPAVLGPPLYPERPIPPPGDTGEEFDPHYFDGSAPGLGRCYLILVGGEPAGQVSYNDIHGSEDHRRVELDIWMRAEAWCGLGYGADALGALCDYLHHRFAVREFMVQPSARNPRAIRAYEKAGFARLPVTMYEARAEWGPNDYVDNVYMVKTMPGSPPDAPAPGAGPTSPRCAE